MKLIVCVKQVPDTSGKVAVNADGTLDRASMPEVSGTCLSQTMIFILFLLLSAYFSKLPEMTICCT